ncbi:casein kinase-like protein I isoform epsilon [Mytilinidion resinicola]|uniref:non-specific serine/threonine protein kinase n=1 Tax=Mytilinidion resinicola TaxID=574789 RepID=A0A6A6Z392_9PEZI|nr:casein kinase-like protein I isoform epsilon [Mytilinidion resinicola]KAF2815601.1 casein kinase-like protein I isoform epsilon [Mytilinidion resinicola]
MSKSEKQLDIRVNNQYRLLRRLGSGGFGVVYEGIDVMTSQRVALKLEHIRSEHSESLQNEIDIYKKLAGSAGIPKLYWDGDECDYNVMVFELLGPNLEDLFNYCGRRFSLRTVLLLADQLIRRFQYIHSKGFLHRDIKPANLLMGHGTRGNIVYITDMGLAKESTDVAAARHGRQLEGPVLGTARYASINAHRGVEQSPADDMEALGYVFVYFLQQGNLPWMGLPAKSGSEKELAILRKKQSTSPEELCDSLPDEFVKYFNHIKTSCDNDRGVDYKYLLRLFRSLFQRHGFEYDNVYDWTVLKYMEYQEKCA